jgi:hypothetical protein
MNERRILQQMAGIRDAPSDRAQRRQHRLAVKMQRRSEQNVKLIEQIMQREQATPGFRMMPFANLGKK